MRELKWIIRDSKGGTQIIEDGTSVNLGAEEVMAVSHKCFRLMSGIGRLRMETTTADFLEAVKILETRYVDEQSHNIQGRTCSEFEKDGSQASWTNCGGGALEIPPPEYSI